MRVDTFANDEGSKAITDNQSNVSRRKHTGVNLHSVRGLVRMREVGVLRVGAEQQHAANVPKKARWRKNYLVNPAALMSLS